MPIQGPMSAAPMGRRLLALIVDWLLCALIASSITGHDLFGGARVTAARAVGRLGAAGDA